LTVDDGVNSGEESSAAAVDASQPDAVSGATDGATCTKERRLP